MICKCFGGLSCGAYPNKFLRLLALAIPKDDRNSIILGHTPVPLPLTNPLCATEYYDDHTASYKNFNIWITLSPSEFILTIIIQVHSLVSL